MIKLNSHKYKKLCQSLGVVLSKRKLQIWNGESGLGLEKERLYRERWVAASIHNHEHFNRWLPANAKKMQTPSKPQLVKNFAQAVIRKAKTPENVTKAQKAARLAVCRSCEMCNVPKMRCRHKSCGCFLRVKAGWLSEECPLGKWEKLK